MAKKMNERAVSIDIGTIETCVMEIKKDLIDIVYNQRDERRYTTCFAFDNKKLFFGQLGESYPNVFYEIKETLLKHGNIKQLHSQTIKFKNQSYCFYEVVSFAIKTVLSKVKEKYDTIVFVKNHSYQPDHEKFLVECTRIAGFKQEVKFIYDNISALCDFIYRKNCIKNEYSIAHIIIGEYCSTSTLAIVHKDLAGYKVTVKEKLFTNELNGNSLTDLLYKAQIENNLSQTDKKEVSNLWNKQDHDLILAVRKAKEDLTPAGAKISVFKFYPSNCQNEIRITCNLSDFNQKISEKYKDIKIFQKPKDFTPNFTQVLGGAGRTPYFQQQACEVFGSDTLIQSLSNEECFAEGALAPMLIPIKIDGKSPYNTVEIDESKWLSDACNCFEKLMKDCNESLEIDRIECIVEKVSNELKSVKSVSGSKNSTLEKLSEKASALKKDIPEQAQYVKDQLSFLFAAGELVKHGYSDYEEIARIVNDPTAERGPISLKKPGPTKTTALRRTFEKAGQDKHELARELRAIYNSYYLGIK